MKRVLFVCVHNSGRSQMAEAFTKHLARASIEVESAGTEPSGGVNPIVVDVMEEAGIDVSRNTPKLLTQEMVDLADRVITMGCSLDEACLASSVRTEDWGLEDPSGKPAEAVRGIRNEIAAKVKILLAELD